MCVKLALEIFFRLRIDVIVYRFLMNRNQVSVIIYQYIDHVFGKTFYLCYQEASTRLDVISVLSFRLFCVKTIYTGSNGTVNNILSLNFIVLLN